MMLHFVLRLHFVLLVTAVGAPLSSRLQPAISNYPVRSLFMFLQQYIVLFSSFPPSGVITNVLSAVFLPRSLWVQQCTPRQVRLARRGVGVKRFV